MSVYEEKDIVLRIDNVSLSFGGRPIIRELVAEIRDIVRPDVIQGQVVGLLGPSGMGKTQIFKMLAGLQEPTSGQVLLNAAGIPVQPGQVGVVPQNYPLFRHRTVLDNIAVGGRQAGMSDAQAQKKAKEYLAQFALEQHADLYPIQLSGGQRQRVAIAQQLICSDHFLLMDEPFSGLDIINKQKVVHLIAQVANMHELNTIIVTTHETRTAIMISDHLWMLGYDKDAEGRSIPGARIQKIYDLAAMGLAWDPDIQNHPAFNDTVKQVEEDFKNLK